jgi:hypothetical protein
MRTPYLIVLVAMASIVSSGVLVDDKESSLSQRTNPIANLISVPIQYNALLWSGPWLPREAEEQYSEYYELLDKIIS